VGFRDYFVLEEALFCGVIPAWIILFIIISIAFYCGCISIAFQERQFVNLNTGFKTTIFIQIHCY